MTRLCVCVCFGAAVLEMHGDSSAEGGSCVFNVLTILTECTVSEWAFIDVNHMDCFSVDWSRVGCYS